MTELIDVDDFLMHYGIPGMKWGKRNARPDERSGRNSRGGPGGAEPPRQGMSRKKKIAIAVGIGATVAIGAAIAISVMNGKNVSMPVHSLSTNSSMMKGKANLIFSAAKMSANEQPPAAVRAVAEKAAKQVSEKAGKRAAEAIAASPAKRGLAEKVKDAAINKAKDMAYERAKEQAMDKAKEFAMEKAKSMLRPASTIPQKSVVFNPKTGLYEEVEGEPAAEPARR